MAKPKSLEEIKLEDMNDTCTCPDGQDGSDCTCGAKVTGSPSGDVNHPAPAGTTVPVLHPKFRK